MNEVSKLIYIDSDSYFNSSHEKSVLYLVDVDSDRLRIFYNDQEVTNVVECESLPKVLVNDCFYVLKNSSEIRLYYTTYSETADEVKAIPVIDSTIKSGSVYVFDGIVYMRDQTRQRLFVCLDSTGNIDPATVSSQIVDSISDLEFYWRSWE